MGTAAMSNILDAIIVQIRAIAARVVGPDGYSINTLHTISAKLRAAAISIDATITERMAQMPSITITRTFIGPPNNGGAA
jgi:hypothetical protein